LLYCHAHTVHHWTPIVKRGDRVLVNSLLEIVGFALLVAAAAFVAIPLAVLVAGLELVLLANLRETRTRPRAKP
jgi:hypothetical protein